MAEITAQDVQGMVSHWVGTPVAAYLGSNYGSDFKALLQSPFGAGLADGLLKKCRRDLPVLAQLPADAVNLLARQVGADGLQVVLQIGAVDVPITTG